jgi:hypothetical protein
MTTQTHSGTFDPLKEEPKLRFYTEIDHFFNVLVKDLKDGSTIAICDYEDDGEFIAECLNVTEYNR